MTVAHGRVGDQQPLFSEHPIGHGFGAFFQHHLAQALCRRLCHGHRGFGQFECFRRFGPVPHFGMPVHGDVCDVVQHLRGAVSARLEIKEFRGLIDEFRVVLVVQELRVLEQVFDEGDICRHTADAEFPQGPVHAGNRGFGRGRPSGDLFEQAVIVARDHRACIGCPAV